MFEILRLRPHRASGRSGLKSGSAGWHHTHPLVRRTVPGRKAPDAASTPPGRAETAWSFQRDWMSAKLRRGAVCTSSQSRIPDLQRQVFMAAIGSLRSPSPIAPVALLVALFVRYTLTGCIARSPVLVAILFSIARLLNRTITTRNFIFVDPAGYALASFALIQIKWRPYAILDTFEYSLRR